jgi:hypothetical protein
MTPVLAFDVESVPDVAGIRKLFDLPADLPDAEVAEVAFQKRRVASGNDFLQPHLQRVVVISCVLRDDEGVRVFSLGEPDTARRRRSSASSRHQQVRAADRVVERARLRPAGAGDARPDPRRRRRLLLGHRQATTRISASATTSAASTTGTST